MEYLVYFLIAIGATTVGALTGMGGGVIIKPLMDVLHGYDVHTIGVLSSITVFTMSAVAIGRHILAKTKIPFQTAVPLALGSLAGGLLGERGLQLASKALGGGGGVTAAQNVILAALITLVFFYMKGRGHIRGLALHTAWSALLAGAFLGTCSAFLGIGGGPINVAVIIFLFGVDTKTATVCSLVTIFFAQASKLTTVALTTGFGGYDLSVAPVMAAAAVAGGFLGAGLNKRLRERAVERAFDGALVLVLAIAFFNIVRNLL